MKRYIKPNTLKVALHDKTMLMQASLNLAGNGDTIINKDSQLSKEFCFWEDYEATAESDDDDSWDEFEDEE